MAEELGREELEQLAEHLAEALDAVKDARKGLDDIIAFARLAEALDAVKDARKDLDDTIDFARLVEEPSEPVEPTPTATPWVTEAGSVERAARLTRIDLDKAVDDIRQVGLRLPGKHYGDFMDPGAITDWE